MLELKRHRVSQIIISHRMTDIFEVGSSETVEITAVATTSRRCGTRVSAFWVETAAE